MKKLVIIFFLILFQNIDLFCQEKVKPTEKEHTKILNSGPIIKYSTEKLLINGVIGFEIVVLLSVLIYWKKNKSKSKKKLGILYKKNINALRTEKLLSIDKSVETKKRKSLKKAIKNLEINSAVINKKAKELKLGKGEIFLAAKIRELSRQAG